MLTGLPGAKTVTSLAELQDVLSRSNPRSLHLAAFHPTGTAAAGADAQLCPVDETGRLRGVDGVWVADASIVPSSPTVNPQVSIMAMALGVADEVVARTRGVIRVCAEAQLRRCEALSGFARGFAGGQQRVRTVSLGSDRRELAGFVRVQRGVLGCERLDDIRHLRATAESVAHPFACPYRVSGSE